MPKVLFYTDTSIFGGAEQQMYLLSKFLPSDQFSITLACGKSQKLNNLCRKFIDLRHNVLRLNVIHKHDPRHYFYLKKIISDFDILHIHLWNPASCRWALTLSSKIPTIITEHDPFKLNAFKNWLKEKLCGNIAKVIVCSFSAEKNLKNSCPYLSKKIEVIPNGIDIDEWRKSSQCENKNEYRKTAFQTKGNEFIVLCVAELHERKGQNYLIEAVRQLNKTNPSIKLVLAGEGYAQKRYVNLVKKMGVNALFLGKRDDIPRLMRASDVFVLPSVREAFGLVILEASISEVPIIASDVGGIKELIKKDETGILVTPCDATALAEKIKFLMENSFYCRKMVTEARINVETRFNAEKMATATSEIYKKIL